MERFIFYKILPVDSTIGFIEQILTNEYQLNRDLVSKSIRPLQRYVSHLKNNLYAVVEYPYVDKVSRDSYYFYFSSKRDEFHRDSIKISFFNRKITKGQFRSAKQSLRLSKRYLGFLVIRPTFPKIIGRSVINKSALNNNGFIYCYTHVPASVNSIKFSAVGFPHSSQDSETMTCAETTIWALMEYFGNKYPEYLPILPSKINKILSSFTVERLLPSKGLTAGQISYALKEIGFGVKLYSKNAYSGEFLDLLKIYVESGIPTVAVIQNKAGIAHAQNIIGRRKPIDDEIDNIQPAIDIGLSSTLSYYESLKLDYVFIDDNQPPYMVTKLETPSSFYNNTKWENCNITNIIVPLYHKIYLEGGEARRFAVSIISRFNSRTQFFTNENIIIRTFLASSRSYKDYIAKDKQVNPFIKNMFLSTTMAKFIWVIEISNKALLKNNFCSGMLVLDSTEPQTSRDEIIIGVIGNYYFSNNMFKIVKLNVPLQPLNCYSGNLN